MYWKPRTYGIVAIGTIIVFGLAYVSLQEEPVLVDLHTIESGLMQITINADGVTRIRNVYDVASPISGTAQRSPVDVGDVVIQGQTIVAVVEPMSAGLLDSRSRAQAEAAVQEAEAALLVAQTDLAASEQNQTLAETQLKRVQTLVERDVASFTALEDAAQRLASADAAVASAQARIDMAEGTLRRSRAALFLPDPASQVDANCCVSIYAPANGVVLTVTDQSERPVQTGAQLVSIGDPADLELVVDLLSTDAVRIAPGASATVSRWGRNTLLDAKLSRIAPAARTAVSALGIEEQRVDAIFDLTSPQDARPSLGHGFSVYVRIVEWSTDNAVMVPLSAIFKRGEDWYVFVGQDGIIHEQMIQINRQNDQFAQVLAGLEPGQMVITHPNDNTVDGQYYALRRSQ